MPCFFNPQHGPSARDVMYTVPRRGTKRLPACSMCASRVAQREKPEVRTVEIGTRKVPYWEAGAAYLPYSQGYFPAEASAAAALTWAFDASYDAFGGGHASGSTPDSNYGGDFGGDFGADGGGGQ